MITHTHDTAAITSVLIVTRYAVLGIGILVLASALGVNTASLAFIGGGLSIGIGFGLQQIVANFISGILLLFEQSLRPGDVIDINGQLGVVEKLNIRSTSILTNDNTQIIVPNERFLTNDLYTYTRDNSLVRVSLLLGVSYSSDPKFVRDLLLKTITQHGLTKNPPAPQVQFMGFGASSLDFRVLVWMDQPQQMSRYRSDLYYMIWEAFARNNIEIPFPQQDIHLRTGWEMLPQSEPPEDTDAAAASEADSQANL
jgi:small-conductance mechanosensitive channel